jgi:hypothetical protein
MSRTLPLLCLTLSLTCLSALSTSQIAEGQSPPDKVMRNANDALAALGQEAAQSPDETAISDVYFKAKTIEEIKLANRQVEMTLSGLRSVEALVTRAYQAMIGSCEVAAEFDPTAVQLVASNLQLFDRTISQIDARFAASIDAMRHRAANDPKGVLAFKTRTDLRRFESAYNDFSRLVVEVRDVVQAFTAMAREMPKAKALCQPTLIPSLSVEPKMSVLPKPNKRRPTEARGEPIDRLRAQ